MLGIKFKIPNTYDIILYKILKNINSEDSMWMVPTEEVFCKDGSFLFQYDIYIDRKFRNMIKTIQHYPIFLNLQLYQSQFRHSSIHNYQEFLDSDCQLILFITDNIFVDVYSKNEHYLEIIEKAIEENNFLDKQYIMDKETALKEFPTYF